MVRAHDLFSTARANALIKLYQGPFSLLRPRGSIDLEGSIEWAWLPSPHLEFIAPYEWDLKALITDGGMFLEDMKLRVPSSYGDISARIASIGPCEDGATKIKGVAHGALRFGDGGQLASAALHVASVRNFRVVRGAVATDSQFRVLFGLLLEGGGWRVALDAVDHADKLEEEARSLGGYGISHIAHLERSDRRTFTSRELDDLRTALFFFLSFVEGRKASPIFPIGYDAALAIRYAEWHSWDIDAWEPQFSWAHKDYGSQVPAVFPGFMRRWQEPRWKETVHQVVAWYIAANQNSSGIETAIVLTQMALERMCWEYLVRQTSMVTEREFDSLRAAERIRRLACELGVPIAIPESMTNFAEHRGELRCCDLADAIVAVRNSIVHPGNRLNGRVLNSSRSLLADGWLSGLWLLEMVLLRVFEFNGMYWNRTSNAPCEAAMCRTPWNPDSMPIALSTGAS